jgi:hypothetical protein
MLSVLQLSEESKNLILDTHTWYMPRIVKTDAAASASGN